MKSKIISTWIVRILLMTCRQLQVHCGMNYVDFSGLTSRKDYYRFTSYSPYYNNEIEMYTLSYDIPAWRRCNLSNSRTSRFHHLMLLMHFNLLHCISFIYTRVHCTYRKSFLIIPDVLFPRIQYILWTSY